MFVRVMSFSTLALCINKHIVGGIVLYKHFFFVFCFYFSRKTYVLGTQRGTCKEYSQHMFSRRYKKNINTFLVEKKKKEKEKHLETKPDTLQMVKLQMI